MELDFCSYCLQMTNHNKEGRCLKCRGFDMKRCLTATDETESALETAARQNERKKLLEELLEECPKVADSPTRLDSIRAWAEAKLKETQKEMGK